MKTLFLGRDLLYFWYLSVKPYMQSLISKIPKIVLCRVSSVLNKDVKLYGKKFLFDNSDETCWSSDQGSPQWVAVEFKEECNVSKIEIQFQGGFVGKDCHLDILKSDGSEVSIPFYPEDVNTTQVFSIEPVIAKKVKVVFESSSDFFGRIVIYSLSFS